MTMTSGASSTNSGTITSINVTPLVDITLVLLIIFMVTAKLIVSHRAMAVDLPKAASGSEVQEIFSVVLSANGATEVNGAPVSDDDAVLPRARMAQSADGALRAVIMADGGVHHSRVMHVLDLLQRAGVSKIGFGVAAMPPPTALSKEGP
jgi:biopolymer transport protein ExbD